MDLPRGYDTRQLTRLKLCDGDIEELGVLITAAYDQDRTWVSRGKCRGWNADDELTPTPWQFDPKQRVTIHDGRRDVVLRGQEMVELALMSCHSCPVQYACATYAVRARMLAGTWAMKIIDLTWLAKQEDFEFIIEMAEAEGVPLQHWIPQLRAIDESADAA